MIEDALLAASWSMVATTSVCISSVRPVVRSTTRPDSEPDQRRRQRRGEEPGDRLAPAVRGEDAGGIGAGAEEGGMAQRDDPGIAEHQIGRQREQDRRQDLRAQRQIAREDEIGRQRRQPRAAPRAAGSGGAGRRRRSRAGDRRIKPGRTGPAVATAGSPWSAHR